MAEGLSRTGCWSLAPGGTVPGFFENEQADGRFPMSLVVILGAGISGHTTATFARKWLGRDHTVTVVSPNGTYNWIPSNIWVSVGLMKPRR